MATSTDIHQSSDEITHVCNFCGTNDSDGFCGDCDVQLCRSCFEAHLKQKPCRHHVLLDITSKQNVSSKPYSKPCKQHPNQIIKLYCVVHESVGCVECFFLGHRTCNYEYIEDAANKFKTNGEATRLMTDILKLETAFGECKRISEQDKQAVAVINNTTVNAVKSYIKTVTSYVAQVEKDALQSSERLRIENETRLEKRSSELDNVGEEIRLCKVMLEHEDIADELFIAAVEIKPKIKKLGENITSLERENVIRKYEFQPNKLVTKMISEGSSAFGQICMATARTVPAFAANIALASQSSWKHGFSPASEQGSRQSSSGSSFGPPATAPPANQPSSLGFYPASELGSRQSSSGFSFGPPATATPANQPSSLGFSPASELGSRQSSSSFSFGHPATATPANQPSSLGFSPAFKLGSRQSSSSFSFAPATATSANQSLSSRLTLAGPPAFAFGGKR